VPEYLTRLLLFSAAIFFYYNTLVRRLGRLSRPWAEKLRLGRRYPLRDISAALNLPLAGLSQLLFCAVLVLLTGVAVKPLFTHNFHPILIVYGVLLGVGEMALATFLCAVAMRLVTVVAPPESVGAGSDWNVIGKGGWMHYHLKTLEVVPLPAAVLSISLYVAVEELIFRGILITEFLSAGASAAVMTSVLLFTVVQMFHMPDWRAAMFPVVGALVMGILHGTLFVAVPNVVPLIIAHLVFFLVAVI
jgi:Type II CAAX prenyl endopeptidase Rce1-like